VSFEPLLGEIKHCLEGLQWIIIGKLTGSRKVKLDCLWLENLLYEAVEHNIPVFMKNNLGYENPLQEFPSVGVKKG